MALQENKTEPKAKDSVKAAPSSKGAEKSEQKAPDSAKTVSGAKDPVKVAPSLKGTGKSEDSAAETGSGVKTPKKSAPTTGVSSGSLADSNRTGSADTSPGEDTLTGPPSGGYGMYIFLSLLLGLFAYLWYRGHLQAFRKYVMETRDQLRKCTWPTRDELYQHTVVVFLSTLMMGLFTVLADQAAALLVWDILLQVPTSMFGKLFGAGV